MHSFIRSYVLTTAIVLFAASAFATNDYDLWKMTNGKAETVATPETPSAVLSTQAVNELRINRQSLADCMTQDQATFMQNELQLQVTLLAIKGENPSANKDRALPALEDAAIAGGARYAMTLKFLQPAANWITRVAPIISKYGTKAPYALGAAAVIYQFADYRRYDAAVQKMNEIKASNPEELRKLRQAEYDRMITLRQQLVTNIGAEAKAIADLDFQLHPYDAFDKLEAHRYTIRK